MKTNTIIFIITAIVLLIILIYIVSKRRLKQKRLLIKWQSLMKLINNPKKWSDFAIQSDKLIIEVLKFKHYKGKSPGERIVSAQHIFTNNDDVWYCHKLASQIINDGLVVEDKQIVLRIIHSVRQSLIDLSLLKDEKKITND